MGDITENFSHKEFACKCKCGFDAIDERLVHRLQVIRDIVQVPMIINSGCRCEKHNKTVGGSKLSYHLKGLASDWRFERAENFWYEMLEGWSGGYHYYDTQGFCHTDIGPRRRW